MVHPRATTHTGSIALLLVALLLVLTERPAAAQYNEYRLGPDGSWVQTQAADPTSPQGIMDQARRHLAEDRPGQARTLLDAWIKQYERIGNEYLPEAYLLRGDAMTSQGDEYEALYDYERVIKDFPASPAFVTGIERELDIGARYVNGYRRRLFGVRIINAEDVGEELLIRVQERMPGSRLAERAGIELADYYYRNRDLALASEAYDLFLKNYPSSSYHMKAMQRRVYSTIAKYKGPKYDGSSLLDAQVLIRRFRNLYPSQAENAGLDEALLARIDESAGAELYESARWYLNQNDEVSARLVLNRLVRQRPRTAAAASALDFLQTRGWLDGAPAKDDQAETPTAPPADAVAPTTPAATPPATPQESE